MSDLAYSTAEIPSQAATVRHENATAERIAMIQAIRNNEHRNG